MGMDLDLEDKSVIAPFDAAALSPVSTLGSIDDKTNTLQRRAIDYGYWEAMGTVALENQERQ